MRFADLVTHQRSLPSRLRGGGDGIPTFSDLRPVHGLAMRLTVGYEQPWQQRVSRRVSHRPSDAGSARSIRQDSGG